MLGSSGGGAGAGDDDEAAASTAVYEALGAVHVVQAYNLQERVCTLYERMLADTNARARKACHVAGASFGYSQASLFIVVAIVVFFGGAEVASGRATFEAMLKSFMCIVFAAMGVAQAMVSFPEIGKAGPAVQRMMALLHPPRQQAGDAAAVASGGHEQQQQLALPALQVTTCDGGEQGLSGPDASAQQDAKQGALHCSHQHQQQHHHQHHGVGGKGGSRQAIVAGGAIANLRGEVALSHVCFSYATRPNVRVLQDFCLEIPAGEAVVVGRWRLRF
jgi:ABC-type multidrug transport system fused ATPase/permease subunit